jgi:predicted lipoprotein with Yx(FWY)xxD motif
MRRITTCLLPALAASLTLAACGGSSYSAGSSSKSNAAATSASTSSGVSASSSTSAVVKTAANSTLGATVLTSAAGMTLYRLSGEQAGKFICAAAACTQIWHPLAASATSAPSGVSSLGAVKRPDGSKQVAYKGMPLYTFAQDRQPGDAKGQGLKDVGTWNAVTVAASASPAKPAAAPESPPAESSGGYRY